jgi:hypothetical protein
VATVTDPSFGGHPRHCSSPQPFEIPLDLQLVVLAIIFINRSQSTANLRLPSRSHLQTVVDLAAAVIIQVIVFINRSSSVANLSRRLHPLLSVAASRGLPAPCCCCRSCGIKPPSGLVGLSFLIESAGWCCFQATMDPAMGCSCADVLQFWAVSSEDSCQHIMALGTQGLNLLLPL